MTLKKQTVWLLTMLSLVIVLSVYYVTLPNQPQNEFAMTEEDKKEKGEETNADVKIEDQDGKELTSGISSDDLFTAIRMEVDELRAKQKAELQSIVASNDYTAEKRSEALDKIQELQTVSSKENIIETILKADENFTDAIVRTDGNDVKVIVKAKEKHSSELANKIMGIVNDEMGDKNIAVEFQPAK